MQHGEGESEVRSPQSNPWRSTDVARRADKKITKQHRNGNKERSEPSILALGFGVRVLGRRRVRAGK